LLAGRLGRITFQQFVERACPSTQLRSWLDLALVLERGLAGPQHLTDRVPGHPETPCDLLDRLALDEVLTSNPCNRLHDQHPPTTRFESKRERIRSTCRGSILDADPPVQGVNIARRITAVRSKRAVFVVPAMLGCSLSRPDNAFFKAQD